MLGCQTKLHIPTIPVGGEPTCEKNILVGGDWSSLGFTFSHPKCFVFSFLTESPSFFDEFIYPRVLAVKKN